MKALFTLVALFVAATCFAGPGGGHSHGHAKDMAPDISKEKTGVIGRSHIERLVKEKKLEASWKKAKFDKSIMINNEWLVTFENEKGVKGKKLYVFLKKSGEFVAANFTGK